MKKIFIITILFLFFISSLFAEDKAARIVYLTGKVTYSRDNIHWAKLNLLQYIPDGSCIKVSENSEAAIILKDRSQIRLKSGSLFCIKKSGSAPEEKTFKRGLLNLKKGALWFRNKRNAPKPLIETPVVTASIRGTEMAINVPQSNKTDVVVLEGKVKCSTAESQVIIKRGEEAKAIGNKIDIVKLIRPENKVQWLLLTPEIVGPKDRYVSGKDKKAIELAKEAMKLLAKNESEKALEKAKKALSISSNRASVNVAMATILQTFGKFNKAIKFALKAIKLDPESVPALLRAVELYLGFNKLKKAENLIDNFKGNKEDARIYLLKGYIALINLNSDSAISFFKNSLRLKPDFSEAYLGLGLAEYYNGKISNGLKHMEYACLLNPLAAYPHYYLGKAIYGIGERKNAEVELKRAIQLDKNDPTPYVYLATIYSDTYRPGDAILALQKAIKLNNNKLATRSRFLLDADRASKNISLSWALSMMGLNEWAKALGDEAVWYDPSNSAAYLFRATEAVGSKANDAETLGDTRRASLLQPVNSNTYNTYTEYQTLLEQPENRASILIQGGTDKTLYSDGFIRGGNKNFAYFGQATYSTTDGPKDDTGQWGENSFIRGKYAINENHQVLFEGILGHSHEQDLRPWTDGDKDSQDFVNKKNYWSMFGGYHWRQSGGYNLLISFQYNGTDGNWNLKKTSEKHHNLFHSRNFRSEFVELITLNRHKISFGGSIEYGYSYPKYYLNFIIPPKQYIFTNKNYQREYKTYFRDLWHINDNFIIDYGLAYSFQDGFWLDKFNNAKEKDRLLPHLGLVTNFYKNTVRLAFYQELQPHYLSGTLQPVEVAGFKRLTGVTPGTWTRFYGAGFDRKWNNKNFSRIEFLRYERRLNKYSPNPYSGLNWNDERDSSIRIVHEMLITEQVAFSINGYIRNIETRKKRTTRTDRALGAKITWVHPSGLILQGAIWLVDQDGAKGYSNYEGDNFEICSLSLQKSFMNKKGLLYIQWENIFDEEYRYLMFEENEFTQLPWQNSRVEVGIRWNF